MSTTRIAQGVKKELSVRLLHYLLHPKMFRSHMFERRGLEKVVVVWVQDHLAVAEDSVSQRGHWGVLLRLQNPSTTPSLPNTLSL